MQRLEVSGAVRPIYGSIGVKRLIMYSKFVYHGLPKYIFLVEDRLENMKTEEVAVLSRFLTQHFPADYEELQEQSQS